MRKKATAWKNLEADVFPPRRIKAICDETETVLAEWSMSGNAHCARNVTEHLKPLLDCRAKKGIKVKMRIDTGFYGSEVLDFLESYANVSYIIGVPQHKWLQEKVKTLSYKSFYGSQRNYATFAYAEGLNGAVRHYSVEQSQKQTDSQMDLFDQDAYTYRVVVSNEECKPHLIFRSYNQRGRIEKHIAEQKNAYALGKMVSKSFTVSKALFWLSHLAFTLMGMLRQVAFRARMKKYRLRHLRFILFSAIGWFVNHAKKKIFKLALPRNGPIPFDATMQRIWAF